MNKSIGAIIVIAFLFRLSLLVVQMNFFPLPDSGKDDISFERAAWEGTNLRFQSTDGSSLSGSGVFIKFGSILYTLFGRVPELWGFILVVLSTVTVYNIYKGAYLLWNDRKQAIRVAWFAALFPELAELSGVLLREVPIHFFLSLAVISLIRYWKYKKKSAIIYFFLYVGLSMLFHTAMVAVLLGFGLGVFLISQEGKKKSLASKVFMILLVAGGLALINYTGFGLSKFGGSFNNALDTFESSETHVVVGVAGYPEWMKMRNGISDIWKLPFRLAAFVFSPLLPFMIKKATHIVGALDALFYLLMARSFYKNRTIIKGNKTAYMILTMAFAFILIGSLGVSNFGTAIRHRAKLLPLVLVLTINYKEYERDKLRKRKALLEQQQEVVL